MVDVRYEIDRIDRLLVEILAERQDIRRLRDAVATAQDALVLPAVLGRICPKPCEKGCRRSGADGPVAVCQLKRFVGDADLATAAPYVPAREPATGKRVAIIGAGPTGLSAAYYLAQRGHACTVIDDQPRPGGRLRHEHSSAGLCSWRRLRRWWAWASRSPAACASPATG